MGLLLHHVSISVSDIDASIEFYTSVLGLTPLVRPPFRSSGAWLACGTQQVHLNLKPLSSFDPERAFNPTEPHFAIRVDDLGKMIATLNQHGYSESLGESDAKRLFLDLHGLAGFPQVFVFDPDRNLVEINASTMAQ
jgi:catechol 2,3-dioxygenase-like lactoylglutathione lyase family enzyme